MYNRAHTETSAPDALLGLPLRETFLNVIFVELIVTSDACFTEKASF